MCLRLHGCDITQAWREKAFLSNHETDQPAWIDSGGEYVRVHMLVLTSPFNKPQGISSYQARLAACKSMAFCDSYETKCLHQLLDFTA